MHHWWTSRRIFMALQWINAFTLYLWLTIQPVYHIEVVGLTAFQLVLVGTVLEGTILIFETPTGIVADTYSRRLSIIIAMFISGIAFLIEGFFTSFGLILIANIIWGFGWTFISGANVAWVTDELGEDEGNEVILQASQWSPLASILGIVTSVGLAQITTNLPIIIAGVITLALALFLITVMNEDNFQPNTTHESPLNAMKKTASLGFDTLRANPILLTIILIGGMRGLWVGGFERLWPAYLIEHYTFPTFGIEVWIGLIKAGVLLLSIVGIGIVRKRFDIKQSSTASTLLQIMYTVIILTSIGFVLVGYLWLAIALFFINQTALAICRPIFIAWINQHAESRVRATMISLYWQSVSIANVIGAPVVGWIAVIRTLRQAFIIASFAMSPALLLLHRSRKNAKNETPPV